MSEIEYRDDCPDCEGDIGIMKGNPMVAVCLDCSWIGNLAVKADD